MLPSGTHEKCSKIHCEELTVIDHFENGSFQVPSSFRHLMSDLQNCLLGRNKFVL